ncbi:MAG: NADH-quinone oxidoreductase subunit A [Elusimicrobiales bacterium]|jgi:NADH-quinone oxidoreductase subunit A
MEIFLFPPVVFIITLLFSIGLSELLSGWAPAPQAEPGSGRDKPYACGEDFPSEKVIPDYQEFFPFAIFFTLLHVAGLVLATWSLNPLSAGLEMVAGYVVAVAVILAVLFAG